MGERVTQDPEERRKPEERGWGNLGPCKGKDQVGEYRTLGEQLTQALEKRDGHETHPKVETDLAVGTKGAGFVCTLSFYCSGRPLGFAPPARVCYREPFLSADKTAESS